MSPHIGYTFPGLGSASVQDLCEYWGNIYARRSFHNVCRFLSGSFYGQDFYALHTLSDFEIFWHRYEKFAIKQATPFSKQSVLSEMRETLWIILITAFEVKWKWNFYFGPSNNSDVISPLFQCTVHMYNCFESAWSWNRPLKILITQLHVIVTSIDWLNERAYHMKHPINRGSSETIFGRRHGSDLFIWLV